MQVETKILVVEDDAITAMDIKSRLEKLHYIVVATASSGEEALACVEKLQPNLIVMDIVLKGDRDGIESAEAISESYGIPIIFLTAYRDDDSKFNRAKLMIPYGYITKPFETRDLHVAIQLALVRKEMEDKLALKEKRYQLLMNNASCGLFIFDGAGIISDINKQGEAIFGRDKRHIINNDFREYLPASEREYATLQIEKLSIEKHVGPNNGHILQPSGAIRDVEFSSVCVETQSDTLYLSVIDDITEKHQILERSLLAHKMSTIGALTLGIIHEINNPLIWLLSNLQFIKEKIKTFPAQDIKSHQLMASFSQYTDESISGAQKIAQIIHDLKGFSYVEDKNIIPVDITDALNSAIHIVEHEIKQTMKLKKEFCGDMPLLLVSTNRLQQVFMNLIVNAAQSFINPKSPKNLLIIRTTLEKNSLRIDFTDNGSGIKPENMEKLFIPFFTTKPKGIGVGLGLSISYSIIIAMGGEISVQSIVNKGTTFSVTLPLSMKASIDPDIKILAKPKTQLKILIVDDLPNILNTLRRLLEEEQIVTVALGGRAALKILEDRGMSFDLVITDINMPDVNGIDLFRYIKKNHPKLASQIIFLTGSISSEKINDFLGSIKNPHLEKPFTPQELTAAIAGIYPATKEK
jgi:PAS domain S-box-containing protein